MGLITASAGPLLPLMMSELNISRGTVSWFVSAPQMLMMVFAVPAGILAGRIGLKKAFAIGGFLQAAAILAPWCRNFPQLVAVRALFGIGVAMITPLAGGIFAQWFSHKYLPLVNSFSQSLASVGQTLAFFATIPIAVALSWRGTLASYSGIALLFAVLWIVFGREKPRAMEIVPAQHTTGNRPTPIVPMTTWQVLRRRETLLLAISLMGAFCLYLTLGAWLPTYYNEVFEMPLAKASSVSAIFKLTGIPAGILGGILPMRLGRRRPLIVTAGLMVGLTGLLCFIVNNPIVIFSALAIYGVFGVIYMPCIYTIPMELPGATPQTGALMLAVALAAGNLGGFIGPVIVGYLADFTGSFIPGLLLCCGLSLSLFIGGLFLPETGPWAREKPASAG